MSSISVVKNTMTQANQSFNSLENELNQLIRLLNSVTGVNANSVSNYVPIVSNSLSNARRISEIMYQLNSSELHILFSDLNSENRKINNQLMLMISELSELKQLAKNAYDDYKFYENWEFLGDMRVYRLFLNVVHLKVYIPNLTKLKTDISMFRHMIDNHSNKLRVGVRK